MSDLLKLIVKELDVHHATAIKALDFRAISADYDYFVIASTSNVRLAWSLIDYLEEALANAGYTIRKVEGDKQSTWILIDCYEVIIHLFNESDRTLYALDKLWGDQPVVEFNHEL